MNSPLTAARLRALLHYDPETGIFTWVQPTGRRVKPGQIAGSATGAGYLLIAVDGCRTYAHRLAWLYMTGEWPEREIDHKDLNPSNNIWNNLRVATSGQNKANQRIPVTNSSGFKGVSWSKKDKIWTAYITVGGKHRYLGGFHDPRLAARAYEQAAARHYGEFARVA